MPVEAAFYSKLSKKILLGCTALSLAVTPFAVPGMSYAALLDGGEETAITHDAEPSEKSPVGLEADTLIHDEENQIITASGDVVLEQNGRILKADKIAYNLKEEVAVAEGNVVFIDQTGETHFAEYATLTRQMREGFVRELYSLLADNSRIWAAEGTKKQEDGSEYSTYILRRARYTACKACEDDPDKQPPWQLKAEKVIHDQENQTISYQHARMEVGGVPVFYTPYFSHPDGTVKRKSGFLTPSFGYNSQLGAMVEGRYYYTMSPDFDATIGVLLTGKEGPVLKPQIRKHFGDAVVEAEGSLTYSERKESEAGVAVTKDEEWRGHLFLDGEWHINDKWRAGADINFSSDDQYLRQYDIDSSDFLMSELYTERFSGRDYAGLSLVAFQDLRVTRSDVDQPNLLPIGDINFMGEPNAFLGGRWHWNTNVLNVARDGNGQDVSRLVSEAGWRKTGVSKHGLVTEGTLSLRGDLYSARDREIASIDPSKDEDETDARIAPRATASVSYPLKRDFDSFQVRVSPQVKAVAMPDMDNDSSIPNEDSQDTQIDISNLFAADRFNGYDRIEDRTHIAYGIRSGIYTHGGDYLEAYLGQSYRFSDNDNPFSAGSGLDDQYSDYVGHLNAVYKRHSLNYRFQLDGSTLESERHELFGSTGYGPVDFSGSYLYAAGLQGSTYPESREEVAGSSSVNLGGGWRLRGSARYDLGEDERERGLTIAGIGLDYTHDCYNVSLYAQRDLRDEESGAGGTTVMFRIGFKNLGDYESNAFSFGSE